MVIKPIDHKNEKQIGLFFPYNDKLIGMAKAIGFKYSYTHRCWYKLYNDYDLKKTLLIFQHENLTNEFKENEIASLTTIAPAQHQNQDLDNI